MHINYVYSHCQHLLALIKNLMLLLYTYVDIVHANNNFNVAFLHK